jgi:uncharacterized protein YegP (UPF0339 family)
MGKFNVKTSKAGVHFVLKAGNGEIIGTSQVYKSATACEGGIKSVMNNAPVASVEDQTVEGFEKQKNPKFEVYTDKRGETRFRLTAKNGEPILASEGYKAKASCLQGVESVRKNAKDATIVKEEEKE